MSDGARDVRSRTARDACVEEGLLMAYRDGQLDAPEHRRVSEHIAGCADCGARLDRLAMCAAEVRRSLDALLPAGLVVPDGASPWRRLEAGIAPIGASSRLARIVQRRRHMQSSGTWRQRRRAALVGAGAVAVIAILLSLAPVRRAAAEFLGVFRVESVAVLPVSQEGVKKLEALGQTLDSGMLGEPVVLREPTEPEELGDVAAAAERAGFAVRVVGELDEGVSLESMSVATGPHLRFEVDPATAQLGLAAAGLGDVTLPPLDTLWVEVDIPPAVTQEYVVGGRRLDVYQMRSPVVTFPPGTPADRLGQAFLRALGLSAEEAEAFARDIDWTSTLVIPMPDDAGTYQTVSVGGTPAVLLREVTPERGDPETVVLVWQQDGVLHGMTSSDGVAPSLMLRAAEALR